MALFKKRAKLQDPFVLEFSKGDSQKLRHDPVVTEVIEELGQQERVARSGIIQQLPLMTLNVACQLFQQLRSRVIEHEQPIVFDTITVLQRQEAGRSFKYEPYVRVKQFALNRHYRDFTGNVINTIFTTPEFADFDYDNKRTWANEFITAYQAANPDQQIVALVPSEAQADAADFRVRYAGLDEVVQPAVSQASEAPASSNETENKPASQVAKEEKPVKTQPAVAPSSAGATMSQAKSSGDYKAVATESASQAEDRSTDKQTKTPVAIPEPARIGQIKVPQFKVQNLSAVPEADPQYVAYQVEQKKRHSNAYLRTLEQRLNADATQDLVSYSEQQRQAIAKQLRDYQAEHETQAKLRKKIQEETAQHKAHTEAKVLADLKAQCSADVQQIQADAERAVAQRQAEYEHQVKETQKDLAEKTVQAANAEFEKQLKAHKTALKQQLASLKQELEQQTRAEYNRRVGQLVANNQNIAGTVYQNLAKKLDEYALEVTKVHLNAVELQASADRAKRNLVDVQQLEHKLDRTISEKQTVTREKEDLQKLLQTQTTELTQLKQQSGQGQMTTASSELEKLLALQMAQNQKAANTKVAKNKNTADDSVSGSNKHATRLTVALATMLGVVTLGGGGLWAYQSNQRMSSALTDSKSQISKTQQAASSLDKKYDDLNTANQNLKGKVESQQSQLSKASEETKTARSQAKEAQNKLSSAQSTATSNANKASQK
ncbi:hypothetical protein [Lactiplantibacillus plantarum]|uniref:hypothetical protein n=1 Tax=Lactiplantibacillus plantarum TaxID=1590 RepID=UPI0021A4D1F1|nr:hypothetical protein [Lactiplantibacillus plantarum]MCT3206474.1 hypothetical protein [Lactiplantibacillus plantarum]MCT3220190.1 hypothetical protein [Lactiplantibacillus plantarum]MCT3281534.1 hypothetical protein [Lactiplantibacillus plantarum]